MNGGAGVLIRVRPALGGDGIELPAQGEPGIEVAFLQDDCGIAEDKIHCSIYVAFSVELPQGMGV